MHEGETEHCRQGGHCSTAWTPNCHSERSEESLIKEQRHLIALWRVRRSKPGTLLAVL